MKKLISALSSFVIAATAMGGSLVMSTTAATNGSVSETIIDIQSDGKNTIEGAKAGDKIPFKVYVPQSSGLNSMGLKLTVNGDATRGQDPSKCGGATEYTLTKDSKLGAKGEKITHPEIFGNYGITISNAKMSDPLAFDSKSLKPADWWKAGMPSALGSATFNSDAWVISAVATGAINVEKNIDSFAAAEAAGLDREADEDWDYKPFYQGFTPVTTWTSDEPWAYKYSIAEGTFVLPSDLPDGKYVVDVFKGEYVSALFLENFYTVKDGQTVDDPYNGNTVYTETQIEGVSGIQKYSTKPLTIIVGEGGTETTTTTTVTDTTTSTTETTTTTSFETCTSWTTETETSTTTTTTSFETCTSWTTETETSTIPLNNAMVLDLVAANKTNTFDGTNNVVEVAAGETVKVNFTVKNDSITSGMEFTFDLGKAAYVADTFAAGRAYSFNTELNDGVAGQLTFTMAANETATARDGATIVTFTVTAPQSGSTAIGLKDGARALVAGYEKGVSNPYVFHGLILNVADQTETTTTTTETTTTTTETTTSTETTTTSTETTSTTTETTTTDTTTTPAEIYTTTTTETTTTSTETTQPASEVLWGDTNNDNQVNIADIILLNKSLAKNATLSAQGKKNADCQFDSTIDTKDAACIKAYLAMIIDYKTLGTQNAYETLQSYYDAETGTYKK